MPDTGEQETQKTKLKRKLKALFTSQTTEKTYDIPTISHLNCSGLKFIP